MRAHRVIAGLSFALTASGASPAAAQRGGPPLAAPRRNLLGESPSTKSVAAGRVQWLRYDTQAHQVIACDHIPPSIDSASMVRPSPRGDVTRAPTDVAMKLLRDAIADCARPAANLGESAYALAESFFRHAYAASPPDPAAFRQLAMLLAERARWQELYALAREEIAEDPSYGWAWLALGLALHRGGEPARASAVFDTALARVDRIDRERLFSLAPLFTSRDSAAYAQTSGASQSAFVDQFWVRADPLWSRPGNEARTEFLARVTFADLRWSVEEQRTRGAESDRGRIYIRYGPPDTVIAMRASEMVDDSPIDPSTRQARPMGMGPPGRSRARRIGPMPYELVEWWSYPNGMAFAFWGAATYGAARIPPSDRAHIARAMATHPANFANVAPVRVTELDVHAFRFRASADSLDVLIAVDAPLAELARANPANAAPTVLVWSSSGATTLSKPDTIPLAAALQWRRRLAAGVHEERIEIGSEQSVHVARGTASIVASRDIASGFALRGFGLSDLVVARAARPSSDSATRWRDFTIEPQTNALPRRGALDLLWEVYDLGAKNGKSEYSVSVTLQKLNGASGALELALAGFVSQRVTPERDPGQTTVRFDRMTTASPVIVEHLSLALGATPGGNYLLTVAVTDKRSSVTVTRSAGVTVEDGSALSR